MSSGGRGGISVPPALTCESHFVSGAGAEGSSGSFAPSSFYNRLAALLGCSS